MCENQLAEPFTVFKQSWLIDCSGSSRPSDKRGPGNPDPEISAGGEGGGGWGGVGGLGLK